MLELLGVRPTWTATAHKKSESTSAFWGGSAVLRSGLATKPQLHIPFR